MQHVIPLVRHLSSYLMGTQNESMRALGESACSWWLRVGNYHHAPHKECPDDSGDNKHHGVEGIQIEKCGHTDGVQGDEENVKEGNKSHDDLSYKQWKCTSTV